MRKAGWTLLVVVLVVVIVAVVQTARSVPAQSEAGSGPRTVAEVGSSALPWPAHGSAAVAIGSAGAPRSSGRSGPVPIASLAKMMTAYVVLQDHPLPNQEAGPSIAITPADVSAYTSEAAASDSVLQVTAGESLTEQQALEALLVASADNVADILAQWDAGSVSAFVSKMNSTAHSLGMDHTHYTDPSGLSATTTSTATDQLIIARKAMTIPTFAAIVAMPDATFPVAGPIQNFDYDVGHDGVVGIKTGSDTSALGCWAFAAKRTVAGTSRTIYGVVLGIPGTAAGLIEPALSAGESLANALPGTVRSATVLPAGSVVGYVTAPWRASPVPVTTDRALHGLVENGTRVTLHVTWRPATGRTVRKGQAMGTVGATGISGVSTTPISAGGDGSGPSLSWRLTRL